jgi:hypothetical protein
VIDMNDVYMKEGELRQNVSGMTLEQLLKADVSPDIFFECATDKDGNSMVWAVLPL